MTTLTTARAAAATSSESAPKIVVFDRRERGVTPRVVALCLLLAAGFGYIVPVIDVKLQNSFLGAQHLPPGAIGVLLALLLIVNPLLGLLSKRLTFGRNELLTCYIACLFACLVPGHGGENYFVPNSIGVFYYGTRENGWTQLWSQLPAWMSPALWPSGVYGEAGRGVVSDWYGGLSANGTVPWAAWLTPMLAWSVLVLAMYVMLGCLSSMLRAQWSDHEALSFPLLRLPLEMTEDADADISASRVPAFFRNSTMWTGFAVAVALESVNGLNVYFPDVPRVPLQLSQNIFSEPPWNQIDQVPFVIYPIAVGVAFLLSGEVSLSFWFFYWFIKVQYIAAYYLGFMPQTLPNALGGQGKIFTGYQHIGAYMAYVGLVLWTARGHLRHVARRAFGSEPARTGEAQEALSYPVAFWGFLLSLAFILAWSRAAGMSWTLCLWTWGCYLIIVIGLSRIIAESGLLLLESGWQPLGVLAQGFGSGPGTMLSIQNGLLPAQLLQSTFMVDMRGFLMPSFVQSFKLAHERGIALRPLLALIAGVTLLAFGVGIFTAVQLGYKSGGGLTFHGFYATIGPRIPAWNTDGLTGGSQNVSLLHGFWLAVGAATVYALMMARARFPGFALHPIGLLICLTSTIHVVWFSVFLGWVAKTAITKFGGTSAYRKMVPCALGVILGEVSMLLFWLLVDGVAGRTGHALTPG